MIINKLRSRFWLLIPFLFFACEKTPEIEQPQDSLLAFYSASQQLESSVWAQRYAPISLDDSDVETDNPDLGFEGSTLADWGQLFFPQATMNGTYDRTLPWTAFLSITPGQHAVRFHSPDEAHRLLAEANIETRPGTRSRLFLVDSLGEYQTFFLADEGRAAARQARIRITHLSPDAGSLELWINGQPVDGTSALSYRRATNFITFDIPENRADTLLRIQARIPGEEGEVLGRANLTIRHGETGHVVIYGYYNSATFEDPATGEVVTVNPDFKIRRFKYN